jgi:DNA-binding response OmpR family regulator
MKLLIVEDDKRMAGYLRQGLVEEGYAVDVVYDGEQGLEMAETTTYDLIVLDVILPGKDGTEVCRELRNQKINSRILLLTCKDDLSDKVKGLDAGADDYLTKPFEFLELFARVRALLRRGGEVDSPVLIVADITLDTNTKVVKRGSKEIKLTRTEYSILHFLMSNPNSVVTKTTIENHVWNTSSDIGSNLVEVHVGQLRAKLGDPAEGGFIRTVRGFGYTI